MSTPRGWEIIDGFRSPSEFERFERWLGEQVDAGQAEAVPVDITWRDANPLFEEWYRCIETGEVWRLLFPDPPSRGAFVPREPSP